MKLVCKRWVEKYLQTDIILNLLNKISHVSDEQLLCHRWLRETPPKRAIFQELYGELLETGEKKVLDVGGGITALTRMLSEKNSLTLLDLLAHDNKEQVKTFLYSAPKLKICTQDWYDFILQENYDVIIANDLFPNADQRLELFIERFLPHTKEIRLALTYYNVPRFYITRRIDAEEILCMLAWNGEMTAHVLHKFSSRNKDFASSLFADNPTSLYPNGRQVCLVIIKGDRYS